MYLIDVMSTSISNVQLTNNTSESESEEYTDSEDSKVLKETEHTTEFNVAFSTKEKYYYMFIKNFYKTLEQNKIDKMIKIIEGESKISLRQLDWFVTRHSNKNIKNKKVVYKLKNEDRSDDAGNFNVHISYKAQLKSYRKKYFDPFRRRKKFLFYFNSDKGDIDNYKDNYKDNSNSKKLLTTIGQLNFFRWAFQYEVIDYVEENFSDITSAMVISNKDDKQRKSNDKNKKKDSKNKVLVTKKGVDITAKKEVDLDNKTIKITVSFD